jgi:hypothetical protein
MPIRINLLAEAQAAEELRRRDPVKRAGWVGFVLVVLMLAWSSSLQLKSIMARADLSRVEGQLAKTSGEYRQVIDKQKSTAELQQKLASLHQLTTNRFLQANFLDALQHTTVEDLQLVRLRVEQSYTQTEAKKAKTDDGGKVTPGKPATATERIVITLDGIDSSANPGDQINKFREVLATNAYFRGVLSRTNGITLKNLSAPTVSPGTGKMCVMFSLECRLPEVTR